MACNQRFLCFCLAGVFILLLGSLVACQGKDVASVSEETAPIHQTGGSLLMTPNESQPNSSAGASQADAINIPTLTPAATPTPTEPRRKTVEEIEATWETSDNLARTHLALQMECQKCHQREWPPQGPAPTEACLACHGGSYAGMTALTQDRSPNPHDFHMGELSCPFCHVTHDPYRNPCNLCH